MRAVIGLVLLFIGESYRLYHKKPQKGGGIMRKLLKNTGACVAVAAIAVSGAVMADPYTEALEKRLKIMEEQMGMMKDEIARVRTEAEKPTEKMMELEEWVAKVNMMAPKTSRSQVFFRGGYARQDQDRTGNILTDSNADNSGNSAATSVLGSGLTTQDITGNSRNGDKDGWYFGAGIEHSLTDDLWGFVDDTSVWGEIMFEYKEFEAEDLRRAPLATAANDSANSAIAGATGAVCNGLTPFATNGTTVASSGPYGSCSNTITVTQFTLTAAPKVKFDNIMGIQGLTPWVIPAGFAFHVISPPSDGVTYMAPGVMFGGGVEYNIWKSLNVGADMRYHLTSNAPDVQLDGLTAGGYLGFEF